MSTGDPIKSKEQSGALRSRVQEARDSLADIMRIRQTGSSRYEKSVF